MHALVSALRVMGGGIVLSALMWVVTTEGSGRDSAPIGHVEGTVLSVENEWLYLMMPATHQVQAIAGLDFNRTSVFQPGSVLSIAHLRPGQQVNAQCFMSTDRLPIATSIRILRH